MQKLFKDKNYFYLAGIYIFLALPFALLRFPDIRNEIKYLMITKEMFINKNYLVLKYFSEFYPDKPPLYFWILGLSQKIFGDNFFFIILFGSIIPTLILILFFYKFLKNFKTKDESFIISLSLCFLPFFFGLSIFSRMDMLMSLFIFLALYYFFGFYYKFVEIKKINLIKFYLFIFFALFTKGVAGFAIPFSIIIVFLIFEGDLKFLKKIKFIYGIGFILILIFLWLSSIYFSQNGKEYLNLMIFNEAIGRVIKAKTHVRPFYYYWIQLPLLIFPYGILFFSALYLAIKKLNFYTYWTKLEKISFIWTIVPLIILSCASGKLSIYLLPIFPAIIIFIFEISLNNKENKIIRYGFLVTEILSFFAFPIKFFTNKNHNLYKKFSNINLSLFIILFFSIFLVKYYDNNYTTKKFINILNQDDKKIFTYKFDDGKNLEFYLNRDIKNFDESFDISNSYILTKKSYKDELDKNFKLVESNKEYFLYENK